MTLAVHSGALIGEISLSVELGVSGALVFRRRPAFDRSGCEELAEEI